MYKKIFITIVLVFTTASLNAQFFDRLYGEIGITAGVANFKSDFGERGSFQNYIQNNGYIVIGVYFLSFDNNYSNLTDYFKL